MYADSSVDRLLAPSAATITAAGEALRDAAYDVATAGRSIVDTCRKVSDVMKALGLEGPSEAPNFGAMSIAIKAAVTTASKYVDAKTGVSLREWAEFVGTARARFDDYLRQLDKVAAIAIGQGAAGGDVGPEQLRADKRIIEDTQFQTKLWRPIMSRLPQLSHLVEAIVSSKPEKRSAAEPAEDAGGWSSKLKGVVESVKERVTDEHAEILRSVLGPITDLRHRITTLHADVQKMSECMFEFEDLLELQRAQIQLLLGEIDDRQIEVLSQRITVAIVLPRLKKRLSAARQRVQEYQRFLTKLDAIRPNAALSGRVYSALAAEYSAHLDESTAEVRRVEEEIAGWRARGRLILDANRLWLQDERAAVSAREMVGEIASDHARDLLAGINRELRRTDAAAWVVAEAS